MYQKDTMEYPNISELNSLQAFIFWFFAIIGVGIYKLLSKIMPVTASLFLEFILSKIEDRIAQRVEIKLNELEDRVKADRKEKHDLASENTKLKGAIYHNDKEFLKTYQKNNQNEE